jgi:hypothetical protein
VTVSATASNGGATVSSGAGTINLNLGTPTNTLSVKVTAANGVATQTYSVAITRPVGLFFAISVQTSATNTGLTLPAYVKNGALTLLTTGTGAQSYGAANSGWVKGTDIYVFGTTFSAAANSNIPVYWKNGALNALPIPAGVSSMAAQGGMFDSSNNLYIRAFNVNYSGANSILGYWKNGAWVTLPMTLPGESTAATQGNSFNGLYEDQSGNIYLSGYLTDPTSGIQVPVYWENGTAYSVSLSSVPGANYGGQVQAVETSPFFPSFTLLLTINSSSSVPSPYYMVGNTITQALPTGATSINGGTVWWAAQSPSGVVYGTGQSGTSWPPSYPPAYVDNWSTLVTLPTPSGQPNGETGGANFYGNDVYIDGTTFSSGGLSSAVYWKNGVLNQMLPTGTAYVGSSEGGITFD